MGAVTPIHPTAFTIPGAAQYTSLSRSRLYGLMQTGELPSVKIGGRRMIRRDALDALFDRLGKAA
ncbi:MAG: helix-turn-helix domain-containing protein [Caulobacteraceae bacterium]|nr:helix-turn-helix domain-containing protein [Caulobacteraceae bacterium]